MRKKRGIASVAGHPSDLIRRIQNKDTKLATELSELALDWYRIKASTAKEDTTDIYVYDVIGGWFGVEASAFVKELNDITTANVNVRINSPGGDVYDSIAIHNALLEHPASVTVYVDALAASGASVIAMAGDKVVMMPGSQMMIHDALMYTVGNAAELREDADWLDKQSQNIAGFYALRASQRGVEDTPDEWRTRMLAETWMFAQEAVDLGLADEIYAAPTTSDDQPVEDVEEKQITARLTFKHPLANRGFNYAGRQRSPEPEPPASREKTDKELIDMMLGGS